MSESFFKEGNGLVQLSQSMIADRIAEIGQQITRGSPVMARELKVVVKLDLLRI